MNPSTAAATAIVHALVEAGVREVVLCPGSRSAPIAYAVRAAERAGRLRLHVRVDERSAGFLALGLGKRTGVPAVIVTTSGTAVANLHPAVLEAHHAHVPLVVLSADRPAELRGTGANQTTTQPGIFAGAVRAEADLQPLPRPGRASVEPSPARPADALLDPGAAALRSSVEAVVRAASGLAWSGFPGADAGPVHLNVQLGEPLVPDSEGMALGPADDNPPTAGAPPRWDLAAAAAAGATGMHARHVESWDDPGPEGTWPFGWFGAPGVDDPADTAAESGPGPAGTCPPGLASALPDRTLVVIGDLPRVGQAEVALDWAVRHRLPVVAEPFGPHPRGGVVQHGVLVLADRAFVDAHEPACVVVVGRPTLSRPVSALVRRSKVRLVVIQSGPDWSVPGRPSERVASSVLLELPSESGPGAATRGRVDWAAGWFARGAQIEASLAADPPPWPSGAAVARTLGTALPVDALLFVGSSNAPRDLDAALGPRHAPLDVVANRGLAGIDGCVSTAVGMALAEPGRPAYALMGDLTFLHDANGLILGPTEPRPDLTIVVVNDDGGGIFHVLEPGEPERAADFERLFGTPTGTDLAALCRAHGIPHSLVATAADLAEAVTRRPTGVAVVEVPADRNARRADAARLRAR